MVVVLMLVMMVAVRAIVAPGVMVHCDFCRFKSFAADILGSNEP